MRVSLFIFCFLLIFPDSFSRTIVVEESPFSFSSEQSCDTEACMNIANQAICEGDDVSFTICTDSTTFLFSVVKWGDDSVFDTLANTELVANHTYQFPSCSEIPGNPDLTPLGYEYPIELKVFYLCNGEVLSQRIISFITVVPIPEPWFEFTGGDCEETLEIEFTNRVVTSGISEMGILRRKRILLMNTDSRGYIMSPFY